MRSRLPDLSIHLGEVVAIDFACARGDRARGPWGWITPIDFSGTIWSLLWRSHLQRTELRCDLKCRVRIGRFALKVLGISNHVADR